ncbi:hypothetical protein HAX54_043186, partial [Datura stramonium]|nr:hypothetical protein [Datura stramonium]
MEALFLQEAIHQFMLWMAIHQSLAKYERLLKMNIHAPPTCVFCKIADETKEHLLFECLITRDLWRRLLRCDGYSRVIGSWQQQ